METMWSKSKKSLTTHAEAYNYCLDKLALRDHSTRELRQKLGECGEYIETVRGVGYKVGGNI